MSIAEMNIGKLGFGLMRLPKKDDVIDIEQTKEMVDLFIDAGFNYFDTAWAYPGSEEAIKKALVERYPRESFYLASKLAAWIDCKTREEAIAQLETSLERSGAGYFDFYLLHNLGGGRSHYFDDYGIWDFVKEKKAEGKIRHYGLSAHCTPEELDGFLTEHPDIEFVQLQINYADWENPAIKSREVYEVAGKHGKPVIVMEPVKGGMLASPPDTVKTIFEAENPDLSIASWGIRFAADLDGVMVVLSGMSSVEQMKDNLGYMKEFSGLSDKERGLYVKAREELDKIPLIPCTTCNYCAKVCPNDIGISGTFTAINLYKLYGKVEFAKNEEHWAVEAQGKKRAFECIGCGQCEEACPQNIAIRDELAAAAELLGQNA